MNPFIYKSEDKTNTEQPSPPNRKSGLDDSPRQKAQREKLTNIVGADKLNYSVIEAEKKGKFRTGRVKLITEKSIQKWMEAFNEALKKQRPTDAKSALLGLKKTLLKDSKAKVRPPKGEKDLGPDTVEQSQAFYEHWIDTVQKHLDHIEHNEDLWFADFCLDYTPTNDLSGLFTKEIFIQRVQAFEDGKLASNQIVNYLWDKASDKLKKRIERVLSHDPKLSSIGGFEYFLEAIIDEHPHGANALQLVREWSDMLYLWENNNYSQFEYCDRSFDEWVTIFTDQQKAHESVPLFKKEIAIPYYGKEARKDLQLTIHKEGKITKMNGEVLTGNNLYVLSKDSIFYGGPDEGKNKIDNLHHTSFMSGKPVICAGHVLTDDSGFIKKFDIQSGHYTPNMTSLMRVKALLRNMGLKVDAIEFDTTI